jgi:hypothetical protein
MHCGHSWTFRTIASVYDAVVVMPGATAWARLTCSWTPKEYPTGTRRDGIDSRSGRSGVPPRQVGDQAAGAGAPWKHRTDIAIDLSDLTLLSIVNGRRRVPDRNLPRDGGTRAGSRGDCGSAERTPGALRALSGGRLLAEMDRYRPVPQRRRTSGAA